MVRLSYGIIITGKMKTIVPCYVRYVSLFRIAELLHLSDILSFCLRINVRIFLMNSLENAARWFTHNDFYGILAKYRYPYLEECLCVVIYI